MSRLGLVEKGFGFRADAFKIRIPTGTGMIILGGKDIIPLVQTNRVQTNSRTEIHETEIHEKDEIFKDIVDNYYGAIRSAVVRTFMTGQLEEIY